MLHSLQACFARPPLRALEGCESAVVAMLAFAVSTGPSRSWKRGVFSVRAGTVGDERKRVLYAKRGTVVRFLLWMQRSETFTLC
jgi:hypothetical protein